MSCVIIFTSPTFIVGNIFLLVISFCWKVCIICALNYFYEDDIVNIDSHNLFQLQYLNYSGIVVVGWKVCFSSVGHTNNDEVKTYLEPQSCCQPNHSLLHIPCEAVEQFCRVNLSGLTISQAKWLIMKSVRNNSQPNDGHWHCLSIPSRTSLDVIKLHYYTDINLLDWTTVKRTTTLTTKWRLQKNLK